VVQVSGYGVGQLVGMLVGNTLGAEDGLTVDEVVVIDVDIMVGVREANTTHHHT